MSHKSPYLLEYRLSDVMAAIQVLAASKWPALLRRDWVKLGKAQSSSDTWLEVFQQHPEFFWLDGGEQRVTLRWRSALGHNYDEKTGRLYTPEEVDALGERMSEQAIDDWLKQRPLSTDEIGTLMNAAIELYKQALSFQQESHWWVPVISSLAGGIIGAILGSILKHS